MLLVEQACPTYGRLSDRCMTVAVRSPAPWMAITPGQPPTQNHNVDLEMVDGDLNASIDLIAKDLLTGIS